MNVPVTVGSVIAQRYQVEGILGEGGMGVVVMATHLVLQQRVAIKFLRREALADADAVERFVREARAAAKVQSEYVVRVQDVAMLDDGTPYIVMEYVEGTVLSKLLETHGSLPVHEAVRYALQTCEALIETHGAGIVHGDLKPENIYIAGAAEGARKVKLLDFGISKILREDRVSRESFVMGTPAYMSPEQFESGAVDVRSDLWSLGAVLYEMLSGAPPFSETSPEAIRDAVLKGAVPPIPRDLPPGLFDIVRRCLEKTPNKRHATAADLAAELEVYTPVASPAQRQQERTSTRLRTTAMSTSQRLVPTVVLPNRRRSHGTWALALLGLAAIVGVVLVLLNASGHLHLGRAKLASSTGATAPPEPPASASVAPVATAPATETSSTPAPPVVVAPATSSVAKGAAPKGRLPAVRRPAPTTAPAPAPAPTPTPTEGDRFGTRK